MIIGVEDNNLCRCNYFEFCVCIDNFIYIKVFMNFILIVYINNVVICNK